jgi:hypothetical protein
MYGGGIEELDRFGIRDLIRRGDVSAQTELALAGSEEWRTAASYPELARYFNIISARPSSTPGTVVGVSKPRVVQPMSERLVAGLLYPLAGGEVLMLLGLALLGFIPIVGRFAPLASTLIMVSIIRSSAEGKLKMPMVDTSHFGEMIRISLRVLFVTIVALLPAIVFGGFLFAGVASKTMSLPIALIGTAIALAVSAIYYPACLATVAVWDNVLSSLNPAYVFKVIKIIGADYFVVIAAYFAASFGTALLQSPVIGLIPIVGTLFKAMVSYWVMFYASHLLGYAIYRHAPELGWE